MKPGADGDVDEEHSQLEEEETEEFRDEASSEQSKKESEEQGEVISKEQLVALAAKVSAIWQRLAALLKFQADEIVYFESDTRDASEQAQKMLQIWMENEEEATAEMLRAPLVELGLEAAWSEVFQSVS
ncbi:PREDICTED: uncharacterized protein LOC106820347 [Priapulus caudatus]|uniref:Uncharacterized protein LOC106820347 n=1 Tax=Priapulus caudatus TaxID=37621 RepID=A0ABM1F7D7_PRICU|nr:PREDICTED: uncharacterized protein LOC106820347 [Priapulus caudatus]